MNQWFLLVLCCRRGQHKTLPGPIPIQKWPRGLNAGTAPFFLGRCARRRERRLARCTGGSCWCWDWASSSCYWASWPACRRARTPSCAPSCPCARTSTSSRAASSRTPPTSRYKQTSSWYMPWKPTTGTSRLIRKSNAKFCRINEFRIKQAN